MGRHRAHALFLSLAALCLTAGSAWASSIVVNGNFDSAPLGTGWTQDDGGSGYPPIVSGSEMPPSIPPQSAPNAAWLGGLFNVTQSIYQDVAVPAGTTKLTLSGYLWITTEEHGGTFDHLYAEIIAPGGTETVGHWTNLSSNTGWTLFSTQASGNYAGQTIRLRIRSTNDATLNTNFFLDTCDLDDCYFYRLESAGISRTRKMVVVR